MATASPVVLKCAECNFESEIIGDFQNHCCSNISENSNEIQLQLKDMVPKEYHRYISKELQNTYVFGSEKEADGFRKQRNGDVAAAVMVYDKSKQLYATVEASLSDRGKELIQHTEAWVVNLLLDWCDQFEQVTCKKTSTYDSTDSTNMNGEGKADVPATNHSSVWSKVATSCLIELHTVHSEKFVKPSMKKKKVWKIISSEMNKMGFHFTPSQCDQKWKNLTKSYRDCVDHNSKSGNDRKECPFYKELEDCYGYRPNVKPVFTLGTESTDIEESAAGSTSSDCDVAPKKKKKNQPNEIVLILDDMRKEHKDMMKTLKDQHEKRMENEQRKIEIMSQLVEAMKNQ